MASTNFIGAGGSQYYDDIHKLDNCWHKGPTMSATGTMTASRTTGNLIEGTISNANSYRANGSYGYPVKIVIASSAGGTIKINNIKTNSYNSPIGGTWSNLSFSFSVDCGKATTISVQYVCQQPGGCTQTTYGLKNNTLSFNEAYTAPDYSINSITQIGIVNVSDYTVNYKIKNGTNNIAWTNIKLYNTNNQEIHSYNLNSTDKGDSLSKKFKLLIDNGFTDGTQYKGSIRFNDSHSTYETGTKNLYTYKTPTISGLTLDTYNFSGFGGVKLTWNTNGRRWSTTLEKDFKTYIEIPILTRILDSSNNNPNDPGTNGTPVSQQSQTLTQKDIMDNISAEKVSTTEVFNTTIRLSRKNESSNVIAYTETKNITIQIKPKYKPESITYYDWSDTTSNNTGNTINPNSILYIDEHPYILVKWSLPNKLDRGNTSGYIVTIYNKDKNVVKTYNVTASNLDNRTGQIKLNIKTDLKRGELNYIGVKAYYKKPNGSGNMEGPELVQNFITPIGKIHKPVISYPISKTTWHNNKFRILLQSPIDDDFDTYSTAIQTGSYRYKDIKVEINGTVYSYTQFPNIFSVTSLRYKDHICINPSLLNNFSNTSSYKIKIQYQKNYYVDKWSEWSDPVILNIQSITELNLKQNELILYTQYNNVRNNSYRLWQVYPILKLDSNNKEVKKGDIIYQLQYQSIYNTILNIQKGINEYATYDNKNCKMNESITKLTSPNNVTTDIITAMKDTRPTIQGRNYKNILIECMNKLI